MNNLNSILLEGNLVRDPELKYTPTGTAVCEMTIASNRFFKKDAEPVQEVSYFAVTTWARLAEVCAEYLTKGRGVRIVGRLKQDRWQDNDGKARSRVYIVAEHVEFKPIVKKTTEEPAAEAGAEAPQTEEVADLSI